MDQKLTFDQWIELEQALNDAEDASLSGMGGRHALLIMVLARLGYRVMSVEEAVMVAAKLIDEGYRYD